MRELELKDINNPERFQELCEQLFSQEYPDFKSIDDTVGDGGCDGKACNDKLLFQFYYPERTGTPHERMERIKKKIARDIKKLKRPFPEKWLFITPDKVDLSVHEYVIKKESIFSPMRIEIWSEDKIKPLLYKHSHIHKAWCDKVYGPPQEVIPPEAITYAKRNDISALLEVDKKIGESLKDWEFSKYYNQDHRISSNGQVSIALHPRSTESTRECPITIDAVFKFKRTPQDEEKRQEFVNFIQKGFEAKLSGENIDKFEVRIGGKEVNSFDSENKAKHELILRPSKEPPIFVYIDLFDKHSIRIHRIKNIALEKIRAGTDEILLSNENQTNQYFKLSFLLKHKGGNHEIKYMFVGENLDAVDGYELALIKNAIDRSLKIKIIHTDKQLTLLTLAKQPIKTSDVVIKVSRLLKDIQDITNEVIPAAIGQSITNSYLNFLKYIHKVITTGRFQDEIEPRIMTMHNIPIERAQSLLKGIFEAKLTNEFIKVNIFGKELNLGPVTIYFDAKLDDASCEKLKNSIVANTIEGTEITITAADIKNPNQHFYHRWLKNPEKVMEQYEKNSLKRRESVNLH